MSSFVVPPLVRQDAMLLGQVDERLSAEVDPTKTLVNGKLPIEPRADFNFGLRLCETCALKLCERPPRTPFYDKVTGWKGYIIYICEECKKDTFG